MPTRDPMPNTGIFHIFNKSIAEFEIFRNPKEFERFTWMMRFFSIPSTPINFSNLARDYEEVQWQEKISPFETLSPPEIRFIAYCLMPIHIHLVLEQKKENAVSLFMKKIQNSYTQYFNFKYNRKGPLWQSRFKHVVCETDDQLLHLTRYVHLNPVTAYLTDKPEDWTASSYREYLIEKSDNLCNWKPRIDLSSKTYKAFTENRIEYQRDLAKIKNLLLD